MPKQKLTKQKVSKATKRKANKKTAVSQKVVKNTATKQSTKRKDYNKLSLQLHKKLRGKLSVISKSALSSKDDWSTLYTPGVGAVSSYLHKKPEEARNYTIKHNTIAVVSDGSAVLGLGNIGPLGALPVMEGKCVIFKEMAGVDAWPLVLDTQDTEEIIAIVKAIAPGFGGINLEDIAAPRCFEIEERLKNELSIPVFHDDQHGTAIVVLAGLLNAAKVVGKKFESMKVVIIGAGAAGYAVAKLLIQAGVEEVIVTDSVGIIYEGRSGLSGYKKKLATISNPRQLTGDSLVATEGADAMIGVSGPGTIAPAHIEMMSEKPIVFALANPIPEIMPDDAMRAGAAVVATGRSDYPNQINNALVFPGIFRGALDKGVREITDEMKYEAGVSLAKLVKKPTAKEVIPQLTNEKVVQVIAKAVKKTKR